MTKQRDYFKMICESTTRRLRGQVPEEIRAALVKSAGSLEHHLDAWQKTAADIEADDGLSPTGKARARARKAEEARAALKEAIDGHGWKATIAKIREELARPAGPQSELAQVLHETRMAEIRRELQRQSGNDPLVALTILQAGDPELLQAVSMAPRFIQASMLPPDGLELISKFQDSQRRARDPGRALLLDQCEAAEAAFQAIAQAALSELDEGAAPAADPLATTAAGDTAAVAA